MIRYLTHRDKTFWSAEVLDDVIVVRSGTLGTEGELSVVEPWDFGVPPDIYLDQLASEQMAAGFEASPIENIHLWIEKQHGPLPEPTRSFFSSARYLQYQGFYCEDLECHVDFTTDAVLGNYFQEHYDSDHDQSVTFLPISGRIIGGVPDEQSWIGIDPREQNGAIYALYTSGDYERTWTTLEDFLAGLRDLVV